MAIVKSPESLPPGWIEESKERPNGKMDSVVQMEDVPNWLPTDWRVVIQTRKSGNRVGQNYKCYIAPITGFKLYSKRQVFSYLKTGKLRCHVSEPNERDIGMHSSESASKVVVEKNTEEGLPPGWIKEIKVTQLGNRTRKDPYYIDSGTGYEFRSKKDVFRYLESGDVRKCKIRPKKRQISGMVSTDGEIFPPTAAKRHKIAGNVTRRCLFTCQSSRSNKAVEHELVLESSVVEECSPLSVVALDGESSQMLIEAHQESEGIKNVEGKLVCAENGCMSASGAEVSPERVSMKDLNCTERESSKLISKAQESGGLENMEGKMGCAEKSLISDPAADVSPGKKASEKPHDAYRESSELNSAVQESRGLENTEEKMVCAEKDIILAPAADVSPEEQPSEKSHPVNRESSELFSVAQQESEGLVYAKNGCISASSGKLSPEKQLLEKSLGKHKKKNQLRTRNSQDGKELPVHRRASKRLAGLRAELAPNLEISERSLRMVAKQSVNLEANPATVVDPSICNHQESMQEDVARVVTTPHDSRDSAVLLDENLSKEGGKPPGDQADLEELVRKLESEKQSTEKPESPLVLPFGDSWPDPCLEFAFKTLTGAIPMDNLVIGEYFQQHLSKGQDQSRSSFTLPDLGSDGSRQSDIMFQFGTAEKPTAKQQSPGKPKY
ncbi:methyl-CpG-binding domain-containing protein 13-like isoform X2 [Macadamia integrifolia]|uniref:methyl-CpG-binding domain-containing protein 13-like isoform X2 n=1 Tax=Macadamia integrifolia TaxID=60698 RepID=UPI001C4F9FE0|nr:methyl-CpG-binding domain-containing protein 13-like isoform X2 [Macadamia integrifolia]